MKKYFVSFEEIRNNTIKLVHTIIGDGFIPDVIYVSLRGGAYMGNVISECFKLVSSQAQHPVFYAAVVARSYQSMQHQKEVMIDGWTYHPDHLRSGDKIMIVDEIYDSGMTLQHLAKVVCSKGIPREDIKIVVHDYKIRRYKPSLAIVPDYYCKKYIIAAPEDDFWIHYLSHELEGLSRKEIHDHYPEALHEMLHSLLPRRMQSPQLHDD